MTPKTPRAALRIATTALALLIAPTAAQASTWTVDDDKAQCPTAKFTSIQDAVDYAAPYDTIIVCDGLYQEHSTPTNGSHLPSQPGSRNGLTISKQLTIKGAGASKVIIEPDPTSGDSLAGTAPYLRDAGGNVISVTRASLGNGDDNEIDVDISGVTVRSGSVYAEAGIAYFNANGTVSDSVVGPLKRPGAAFDPAAPHGWGVIQTNFLQGGGPGSGTVRRSVTVEDSVVKGYVAGGVLFDGGRGPDADAPASVSAGINQLGFVKDSKIEGGGLYANVAQTGVRYAAGARGSVTGSEITDNLYSSAAVGSEARSYGVFLADSLNGADPDQNGARGVMITGNYLARNQWALWNGVAGATAPTPLVRSGAPVSAPGNFWGCATGPRVGQATQFTVSSSTGIASFGCGGISGNDAGDPLATPDPIAPAASVEFAPFATASNEALPAPSTSDAAPTVSFTEVTDLAEVPAGTAISPVVSATDDFGVSKVELLVDGAPYATISGSPYEFTWTPLPSQKGMTITLTAVATDSSGKTSSTSAAVKVTADPVIPPVEPPAPPAPPAPVALALPLVVGDVLAGETVACSPGTWSPAPMSLSFAWLRGGLPIAGATTQTYEVGKADIGSKLSCVVGVGGVAATSPARAASLKVKSTKTTTTFAVGPAIITLSDPVTGSRKTGSTRIAGIECVAGPCTVVTTGKIKVGSKTASFPKVTVSTSGKAGIRIKAPASLRSALRKTTGTATVKIAVTAGGVTSTEDAELAIKLR